MPVALRHWYGDHGRHDLAWRRTRDRWAVLVSEVMLAQTQVGRVATVWPSFMERFPTPEAMAASAPGDVIVAWGNLGYPRRARRLWEAAGLIAATGWPDDLAALPGVGRYTAAAVAAQADGANVPAVETNIRRVLERRAGRHLTPNEADAVYANAGRGMADGRDRLLALMDVGALLCRPRVPECKPCPLRRGCATASGTASLPAAELGRPARQAAFAGSFRQRRGLVLASLRSGPQPVRLLDAEALASLVDDGLALVAGPDARLP